MRVIPFGVSSGRPTAGRNVSGLGVDLGHDWILVDCGEGTQQQVMRSSLRISRIAGVLLTHLHGDHVLGLPGLLGTMGMEDRSAPLYIVGPTGVAQWLDAMMDTPILGVSFPLVITELDDDTLAGAAAPLQHVADLAGCRIETLPLRHRVPCFGYRISEPDRPGRLDVDAAHRLGIVDPHDLGRLKRGESVPVGDRSVHPHDVIGEPQAGRVVTVLGDTTPCAASIELARNTDLLVHEATYGTEVEPLGELWRHSSAAQAASIALAAQARCLVINHFSSRYDTPTVLGEQARAVFTNTVIAEELVPIDVSRST